jgi:hypothetical protein
LNLRNGRPNESAAGPRNYNQEASSKVGFFVLFKIFFIAGHAAQSGNKKLNF